MAAEPILEPELPIIDPHHHLWDRRAVVSQLPPPQHAFEHVIRRHPHYMLDELLADMKSGHNVRATVFLECGSMYRADAAPPMRPVGETEFVNGVAAMGASNTYGDVRPCAGIVGHADLREGAAVRAVLEAHIAAGGGRFRGIRHSASWDADTAVLGPLGSRNTPGLYRDATFREGFAQLGPLGLSFDAWLLEPQLGDLTDLARAFPGTRIVLDHVGTPLGLGRYAGTHAERFAPWREAIQTLARCENVFVKLGGLAMAFPGLPSYMATPAFGSEALAAEWKPYIETCIEAFGAKRAMFESNFPVDGVTCTYDVLWNAFKRLAAGCSASEKKALFFGAAAEFYRLSL